MLFDEDDDDSFKQVIQSNLFGEEDEVNYHEQWIPSQRIPSITTTSTQRNFDEGEEDDDDVVLSESEDDSEMQEGATYFLQSQYVPPKHTEPLASQFVTTKNIQTTRAITKRVPIVEIQGTMDEEYLLEYWGIDPLIREEYRKDGVTSLYPWQVAILQLRNVRKGTSNLIYCAPTSGGKTLVTEILMLKRLTSPQNTSKKAFFIVPFISIVEEKVAQLQRRFRSTGLQVGAYFANTGGSIKTRDFTDTNIIVCTIERGNSIIHQLIASERIDEISMIIIDECHMIGDKSRGYLLESMLTKLVYLNAKIQVIGMSATLPNLDQLAAWLNAELFITNYRPVPLREYVVLGTKVYDAKNRTEERIVPAFPNISQLLQSRDIVSLIKSLKIPSDMGVAQLCHEMIVEGKSVLIFCKSRFDCAQWAKVIALLFQKSNVQLSQETEERRQLMTASLNRTQTGLDPDLELCIKYGVAFHHAGLTKAERETVEREYREGTIQVLTCTTTLSAGVNLPARRVIFASMKIATDAIDVIRYRQSAGRAGRAGLDDAGESFLITTSASERERAFQLVSDHMPELVSSLCEAKKCMPKCLLEAFDGDLVKLGDDIGRFARCTLYRRQIVDEELKRVTAKHLQFLLKHRFVYFDKQNRVYNITHLGRATTASGFTPEESLFMKIELDKAQNHMILQDDLHILYHLTPFNHNISVRWRTFAELFQSMTPIQKHIAKAIGVQDEYLASKIHGREQTGYPSSDMSLFNTKIKDNIEVLDSNQEIVQMRFFAAMVLRDLIDEVSLSEVSQKYGVARGQLQALQESATTFSGMLITYCAALKWKHLKSLFGNLRHRLNFGVKGELVPLCSIPRVKSFIARALYKGGFKVSIDHSSNNNLSIYRL
jgi:DNA polymerase theta